jgi:uncharacterized protein YbaA (DUF1428 family)
MSMVLSQVPTANREKFKKHAEIAAMIFKENGALSLAECWGRTCRRARSPRSRCR